MTTVDNRGSLYELDEIFKYKNLIDSSDNQIIKEIICCSDEQSKALHTQFTKLVAQEVDHILNKTQFTENKDTLVVEMRQHLDNKRA
jgi:hypothetical protein